MRKEKLMKLMTERPKSKAKVQKSLSERNLGRFERDAENATTIYIGNLSYTKKEQDISNLFSKYGAVGYVRIVCDQKTHKSKGIAFVQMPNFVEAMKAIKYLNATELDGRMLKVSVAVESAKAKKSKIKAAARPYKAKTSTTELALDEVETKKVRPSRRKRDKGLKLLFNHLNA
jgi:RNA recognition motif-containing protein